MRLIDAKELLWRYEMLLDIVQEENARPHQIEEFKFARQYIQFAIKILKDSPTIDAIEVVRCKDCERVRFDYHDKQYPCFCDKWLQGVEYDDYCSYGEGKEDEIN